jgi:hypothetical protein
VAVAARAHHGTETGAAGETVDAAPAGGSRVCHSSAEEYLRGLAALCLEVARRPALLPTFVGILRRVPGTLMELLRADRRRIAA